MLRIKLKKKSDGKVKPAPLKIVSMKPARRKKKKQQAKAVEPEESVKQEMKEVLQKVESASPPPPVMVPQTPPGALKPGPYCAVRVPCNGVILGANGPQKIRTVEIWVRVVAGNERQGSGFVLQGTPCLPLLSKDMPLSWIGGGPKNLAKAVMAPLTLFIKGVEEQVKPIEVKPVLPSPVVKPVPPKMKPLPTKAEVKPVNPAPSKPITTPPVVKEVKSLTDLPKLLDKVQVNAPVVSAVVSPTTVKPVLTPQVNLPQGLKQQASVPVPKSVSPNSPLPANPVANTQAPAVPTPVKK